MAMRRAQGAGLLSAAAVACLLSAPSLAQDCREATTRVVGGKQARISQWPGEATLRSTTKGGKSALDFLAHGNQRHLGRNGSALCRRHSGGLAEAFRIQIVRANHW